MTNKASGKFKEYKNDRKCKNCEMMFSAYRDGQVFCSAKCRIDSWRKANSDPQKIFELEKRVKAIEDKLLYLR